MGAGEELMNNRKNGIRPGGEGRGPEGDSPGEVLAGEHAVRKRFQGSPPDASSAGKEAAGEETVGMPVGEPAAAGPAEKTAGSGPAALENAAAAAGGRNGAGPHGGDTPEPPSRGGSLLKKRLLAAGIALIILVGIGMGLRYMRRQDAPVTGGGPEAVPVEVAAAATGEVRNIVKVTGNVAARTEINLIPKIPGKVQSISVDVGDSVSRGQVLVKLEDTEVRASLRAAEAALEAARAGARAAEANLADARRNLERMQQLYDSGAVSLQQLEQAQLRYDQAAAGVSDAQVRQAEAAVETARLQLDNTVIVSPINGVVAARFADPGEMAGSTQPLLTLVDISEVQVTCNVTGADINNLTPGQSVPVVVTAAGRVEDEQRFTGKIVSLAPAADTRTKLFPVKVAIPNPERRLKPGMFAEIYLTTAANRNALRVPVDAVVEKDGLKVVYVLDGDSARERRVETGLSGDEYIEIKGGLKPGERVVVTGQEFLTDGTRVHVSSAKAGGQRKGAA